MAWDFVRTFKHQQGWDFTFDCDIREDSVSIEHRDFTVTYDPAIGLAAQAAALKAAVAHYVKLILVSRSAAVSTPTVVPLTAEDLA